MTDEKCSVWDCENETASEYSEVCDDHAYCCPRCGNNRVKAQSLSQRPILCEECGWVPDQGGLTYLFDTNHHFGDWELVTNTEDELIFRAPWMGDDVWRFHSIEDPLVGDWKLLAVAVDGSGLWDPGGVDTWTDAVAFFLDTLDVCEDSQVRPTEKIT